MYHEMKTQSPSGLRKHLQLPFKLEQGMQGWLAHRPVAIALRGAGRLLVNHPGIQDELPTSVADLCVGLPTGLWLSRREELGHPLGIIQGPQPPQPRPLPSARPASPTVPFVLEIGTEELPPEDLDTGLEQLRCVRCWGCAGETSVDWCDVVWCVVCGVVCCTCPLCVW